MKGILGSAESQAWRRRLLGREPNPERDLRDYLAGEFQSGTPLRVTSRRPAGVGQQLAEREVSRLEVLHAMQLLSYRQRRVVELLYLDGATVEEASEALRVSTRTLLRLRDAAIRAMVGVIYEWR